MHNSSGVGCAFFFSSHLMVTVFFNGFAFENCITSDRMNAKLKEKNIQDTKIEATKLWNNATRDENKTKLAVPRGKQKGT